MEDAAPGPDLDGPLPRIDEDGLLRSATRWVAVPDAQLGVLRLLLDRYGSLVPTELIATTYASTGRCATPGSVRSLLHRIDRTVRPLGLRLESVRGRGVVLTSRTDRP